MTRFVSHPWTGAELAAPAPRTVVLAEDDEMVRRLAARMLAKLGFTVIAVRDGREALRAIAENLGQLRVAVVDLRMPEVDGREVLRRVREGHPGLPTILMTGHASPQVIPGCPPPDAWLHKPFSLDELQGAIALASPAACAQAL